MNVMSNIDVKGIRNVLAETIRDSTGEGAEKIAIYGLGGVLGELGWETGKSWGTLPEPEYFITKDDIAEGKTIINKPVITFEEAHELCKKYLIVVYGTSLENQTALLEAIQNDPIEGATVRTMEEVIYRKNADKILAVYDLLEDDFSKATYANILMFRMGKEEQNQEFIRPSTTQYFDFPIFANPFGDELFVDCGAYVGDTLEKYLMLKCGAFRKIVAFEPMDQSFSALSARVERLKKEWAIPDHKIELVHGGIGAKNYQLDLSAVQQDFSDHNLDASTFTLAGNNTTTSDGGIPVYSIDKYFSNEPVSFIKADIEGYEWLMLAGARKTIKRDKPKLALCLYHN